MSPMRDVRTDGQTWEDSATQPMDAGRLSFAITTSEAKYVITKEKCQMEAIGS